MRHRAFGPAGEATSPGVHDAGGYDDELRLGDLMRGERATLGKSLLDVQRELKIKAAYIAAIENADLDAFETPSFVAGYVRAYARYLGLDPDRAFAAFCAESGLKPSQALGASATRRPASRRRAAPSPEHDVFAKRRVPYAPPGDAVLSRIEPGAVASLAVLIALIAAVGWGGWTMLQEMQRVTLLPAEDAPAIVAEIDPLAPEGDALAEAEPGPPEPDALDRLYRPRALDVPVLVARDGPIAALDPDAPSDTAPAPLSSELAAADLDPRGDQIAPLRVAAGAPAGPDAAAAGVQSGIDGALRAALAEEGAEPATDATDEVRVVGDPGSDVVLVAVRPAWVRVRAADGTVVLEKIMETGERYAVPPTEAPATLRTGNAGGIYFSVGDRVHGPAGEGPVVASDVALSAEAVTEGFAEVDLSSDPDLARMVRVAEAAARPSPGSEPAPGSAIMDALGPQPAVGAPTAEESREPSAASE